MIFRLCEPTLALTNTLYLVTVLAIVFILFLFFNLQSRTDLLNCIETVMQVWNPKQW